MENQNQIAHRSELHWDVKHHDRTEMMMHAISLVEILSRPIADDPWAPKIDLGERELLAYDAALMFLANEFADGVRKAESHMTHSTEVRAASGDIECFDEDDEKDHEDDDFLD